MEKRILVCGGAGFIGSNYIHYVLDKNEGDFILNYDKLTYAANLANHKDYNDNENYHFIKGDICDKDLLGKIIKDYNIDHIINFAAETHVDRSIHCDTSDFVKTNVLGVQTLLDLVKENNIKRFIHVSTDEVYGALDLDSKDKFTEDSPFLPNNPYSASKAGGDLMCRAYHITHKLPVIVTHCSNNYGPYQFIEKMIPFFIFKALNGEKLPLYGDGLYVRDLIYVKDHVSALHLLFDKGVDGEIYNIGVDNEVANIDVTKMILKELNLTEDQIEYVKDRPGHDRKYAIDSSKVMSLGWTPKYDYKNFSDALKNTIKWYLDNKEWVEAIKEKNKKEDLDKFI